MSEQPAKDGSYLLRAVTPFEVEVLRSLAAEFLGPDVLEAVLQTAPRSCEHTGAGYYLTIEHPQLPRERKVLHQPMVRGRLGDIAVGFVVFVEAHQLTLECHGWGDPVPSDTREHDGTIIAS